MPWKERNEVDLRHEFVTRALSSNSNISDLCREYGISRTAGYKWINRFKELGYEGLANLSRRPLSCPHEVSVDMVLDIVALKAKHTNWGPKKIHT